MHQFKVWAPRASSLHLRIGDATLRMTGPDDQGWWKLDVPGAQAGMDYGYCFDSDPKVYPDPRSEWQPGGVHGMSRLYDQKAFSWSDRSYRPPSLENGVIYELHVGTFTPEGTFDAAISGLDYLAGLGITHIELMPIASFAGHHGWGYDGVAIFAVHQPYGGPDALKRFVDAAHRRGLAVLLDVVYNHFGPVGNYTGKFGPYTVDAHRTPWGGAVNLEESGAHQVRRFFCDNAVMWLRDFHVDGLRIDAVHAFVDRSAIHFLEQLSTEVDRLESELGRVLVLIAESDLNDPRIVTPRESGGLGVDAQWSDDFHHALFTVLAPRETHGYYADFGKLSWLAKALDRTFVYDGIYSRYRNRIHGKPPRNIPQTKFMGYIQNHDQIGNRAIGDRIKEIAGFERAKIAAAVVMMSPFVPLLFQGEEWAASSPFLYFADHDDPAMAAAVSHGRKQEFIAFGWDPVSVPDPEASATFARSKLNWDELDRDDHREMLLWYRDLIRLRKRSSGSGPNAPRIGVQWNEEGKWFAFPRAGLTLYCNLGKEAAPVSLPVLGRVILASRPELESRHGRINLPPDTVIVFSAD